MLSNDYDGAVSYLEDPTEQSRWRPFRLLRQTMDDDIGRIYDEAGMEGFKSSWVMELLRLRARGPMTISELAESVQRTHSALSQKVLGPRGERSAEPPSDRQAEPHLRPIEERRRHMTREHLTQNPLGLAPAQLGVEGQPPGQIEDLPIEERDPGLE